MSVSILCVSDSDTRMKWTAMVAAGFAHLDPEVKIASLATEALPSARQLAENQLPYEHFAVELEDFYTNPVYMAFDVIIANTVGTKLFRLQNAIADHAALHDRRPLLVTGYAGVVYEKHAEGLLWRTGADVICCNSDHDQAAMADILEHLGMPTDCLVRAGYPAIQTGDIVPPHLDGPPTTVTFAIQPDVPKDKRERVYLLERLVGYARSHPDRRVIVKLRSRPDEVTTHVERFHYQELYDKHIVDRPPNIEFVYGRMDEVLADTDLLLTVSSTAALEAWAMGKPCGIIADLGVKESLGNHFFLGSGAYLSMNQLMRDEIPAVKADWLLEHGLSAGDDVRNVAARAMDLIERQRSEGKALLLPDRFYTPDRTPFVLHAVNAVARPVGDDASGGTRAAVAAKKVVKRALHGAPRRLYRRLDRWIAS